MITDQSYNGGFMSGRITSIFVASVIRPRNMILVSLVLCVAAASILVAIAGTNVIGLYAGTGNTYGFFFEILEIYFQSFLKECWDSSYHGNLDRAIRG